MECKIFRKNGKHYGFAGSVKVYDDDIFIDTRNGKGYDLLFNKMRQFVSYTASKYNMENQDLDDMEQNVALYILEGLPYYNPNRGTKLSTFLQMRINRQIINEIKRQGTDSRNPTLLKTTLYSVVCDCGRAFTLCAGQNKKELNNICYGCNKSIKTAKIFPINKPPVKFEDLRFNNKYKEDYFFSDDNQDLCFIQNSVRFDENFNSNKDVENIIEKQSTKVKKMLKAMCFDDQDKVKAIKASNMSYAQAVKKIERLKENKIIQSMRSKNEYKNKKENSKT